jgi:hypothetical protein
MLPRQLRIKWHTYHVKQVTAKNLPVNTAAVVDLDKNVILIEKGAPPSRKTVLLIHEALHALVVVDHIPNEEKIVSMFAEHIVQLMADNPPLVRHLLSLCRK